MADDKDLQAFKELQMKLDSSVGLAQTAQQQLHRARLGARRAELTLEELSGLPSDVPVYKQVGKAYFMAPLQQLAGELKEDIAARQDEAKRCVQQKEHADKAIAAAEKELRELIKSHPEALRMLTAASG